MIQTFITKPTVRQAVQWTGANFEEIDEFTGQNFSLDDEGNARLFNSHHNAWASVFLGDWVLKGADGEVWPVERKSFAQTYELLSAEGEMPEEFFRELFAEMANGLS